MVFVVRVSAVSLKLHLSRSFLLNQITAETAATSLSLSPMCVAAVHGYDINKSTRCNICILSFLSHYLYWYYLELHDVAHLYYTTNVLLKMSPN